MVRLIDPAHHLSLDDYGAVAYLGADVADLRLEAESLLSAMRRRRVWMVNSSAQGGGVAELLPPLVTLMSEVGFDTRWLVIEPEEPEFFRLTKRLHNLVQGHGDPSLSDEDRELYETVSQKAAEALAAHVSPGDVVVIHDPQPMAAGAFLSRIADVVLIWRCHIGMSERTPETAAAWDFLSPYASAYERAVFSAPEYIPDCLASRSTIIHPAIDPLSHKNRELPVHKLTGILVDSALVEPTHPVPNPPFDSPARRLQQDGGWAPATRPADFGLLYRPIVTQISRWDRLKGFLPLLDAFVRFKSEQRSEPSDEPAERAVNLARLVLAGPEPESIEDDPEATEVLEEVCSRYLDLPPDQQDDIAIVSLPMASAKENALIVNALHRCSDIVVQNSLREGFGLTVTEAMWKSLAVVGTHATGLRQQVRDGLNGRLVKDPADSAELAGVLRSLLLDAKERETLGRRAQQRVHADFLVFTQVRCWIELIADSVSS